MGKAMGKTGAQQNLPVDPRLSTMPEVKPQDPEVSNELEPDENKNLPKTENTGMTDKEDPDAKKDIDSDSNKDDPHIDPDSNKHDPYSDDRKFLELPPADPTADPTASPIKRLVAAPSVPPLNWVAENTEMFYDATEPVRPTMCLPEVRDEFPSDENLDSTPDRKTMRVETSKYDPDRRPKKSCLKIKTSCQVEAVSGSSSPNQQ